jgi:hypothetical protein
MYCINETGKEQPVQGYTKCIKTAHAEKYIYNFLKISICIIFWTIIHASILEGKLEEKYFIIHSLSSNSQILTQQNGSAV